MSDAAIAGVAAAALLGVVGYYRRSSTRMLDVYCDRVNALSMDGADRLIRNIPQGVLPNLARAFVILRGAPR